MTIAQLPFPKHAGMVHVKDYTLPRPLLLSYGTNVYTVPDGTPVKLVTSQNHGLVIVPEAAPNGQRIFRY